MTPATRIVLAAVGLAALAGCSSDMDEMRAKIDEMKSRPSRGIEPLPALHFAALDKLPNVLYMALVCPYCNHYHLGTCRAGFHLLSRQVFKPQPGL